MASLLHLLTDLALDPKKQRVFINNPSSLMDEVGLSEAEQTAVMSGEGTKIAAFLANELAPVAITLLDPGPDPLPNPDPFPVPEPNPDPPDSLEEP